MSPNIPLDISSDNRAMTKFDISSNYVHAEGGKAVAAALKGNQVITELNISDNALGTNSDHGDDTSGIIAIADAIPDMGAMTSLDVSNNGLYAEGTKLLAEALKGNQLITELNLSSNFVTRGGMSGVVTLADAILEMGTLTSLNLSSNFLEADGAEIVVEAIKVTRTGHFVN
jgi:Ran GTPase-activating protein (RanGAP) involved in mRNA processing and transport